MDPYPSGLQEPAGNIDCVAAHRKVPSDLGSSCELSSTLRMVGPSEYGHRNGCRDYVVTPTTVLV